MDPALGSARRVVDSVIRGISWKRVKCDVKDSGKKIKYRPNSLEWNLSNLTCVQENAGKKPMLVFINSSEVTKRGKKRVVSKQCKESTRVNDTVFQAANFKMQIASKMFTYMWMDTALIKKDKNKFLCSDKAPMVAIYSKDGVLQGVYRHRSATLGSIYPRMCKVMKAEKVDLDKSYRTVYANLEKLYKNEILLYRVKVKLGKEESKLRKMKNKTPSAGMRVDKAKKVVDKYQATSDKLKKSCKDALSNSQI